VLIESVEHNKFMTSRLLKRQENRGSDQTFTSRLKNSWLLIYTDKINLRIHAIPDRRALGKVFTDRRTSRH
jgi:hypothetical protein